MKDLNDVIAALQEFAKPPDGVDENQVGPAVFEPAKIAETVKIWWESGAGDKYIIQDGVNGSTRFDVWNENKLIKLLRTHYLSLKTRKGETLAQVDQVLLYVMQNRRLDLVLDSLPGYTAGIHEYAGKRMLVRTSPRLLEPVQGDWPVTRGLISGCLDLTCDGGIDQTAYFYSWLKIAVESLYRATPGNHQSGQCCIFAGPKNCGKSRIQHWIITGLLGGRSADPGPYLFGDTDFNGEWLEGEHLLIEDPATSTNTKDRVFFGERIKQTVISDKIRIHIKRLTALNLELFIRMSISVNDDPDKMRVLPLLTPDMKDKVHLFLVRQAQMPMPTLTLDERMAFKRAIADELPCLLHWLLNEFEIPEDIREDRMGVQSWRHPTIEREMFEDTPGAELLNLLDLATWDGLYLWQLESTSPMPQVWEGTALDLELLLTGKTEREDSKGHSRTVSRCTVGKEAERLLAHNKLDRVLSRLKEDEPDRVIQHRTKNARNWLIHAPVGDA